MEFFACYSMLQVKAGVMDEWFLTSTQTGTSGSSCEDSFTVTVCFIILYRKYLVYLAGNQDLSLMCLIHTYSSPPKTYDLMIYLRDIGNRDALLNKCGESPICSCIYMLYFLH